MMMSNSGTILEGTTGNLSEIYGIHNKPTPIDIPKGVDIPPSDCDCKCHVIDSPVFLALDGAKIGKVPCVECRCWD